MEICALSACYRQELATWSEQYYHAPRWTRILLRLGATPYRCAACRSTSPVSVNARSGSPGGIKKILPPQVSSNGS